MAQAAILAAWLGWGWSLWDLYFHAAAPAFGPIAAEVAAWRAALGWHAAVGLLLGVGTVGWWRSLVERRSMGRTSLGDQRRVSQPRMRGEG
ncbi:MAG TPA: hypothetical protein VF234_06095 [Limnochordia bacterium]